MLYLPLSKFVDSAETAVAPGVSISAEGQALVRVAGAPAQGAMPSTGVGTHEIFAGFAIAGVSAAPFLAAYNNKVETFVVPSSGIVTLAFVPVAGQLLAWDVTANADAAPTVNDNVLSDLTAGHTVTVTYKYAMTVVQSRAAQGDVQPGGYAGDYVGQVGLVKRGLIYTSEFDASVDWAAATAIKLSGNGIVTDQNGTGTTINGYVVAVPSTEVPYLGLEFSAA